MYEITKNKPVARFFYRGQRHSHPIRRTVLVIFSTSTLITGYELREGSTVRKFKDAPIKSYRKDRIAKVNEIDKRRILVKTTPKNRRNESTLIRSDLMSLIKEGT